MNSDALDVLITANPTADAAAILALAQADPRTVNPIPLSVLNPYLSAQGLTAQLADSAAAIASANLAGSRQLKSFLSFCASAANPTFDTTNPEYAAAADALFTAMIGLNSQQSTLGVTEAQAAAIIAMGGGYLLKDATMDQVTAAIAQKALTASYATLSSLVDADYFAANTLRNTRIDKMVALQAAGTAAPATLADLDGGS